MGLGKKILPMGLLTALLATGASFAAGGCDSPTIDLDIERMLHNSVQELSIKAVRLDISCPGKARHHFSVGEMLSEDLAWKWDATIYSHERQLAMIDMMLHLVKAKRIDLKASIKTYVPWLPEGWDFSIEKVMRGQSGVADYAMSLAFQQAKRENPDKTWTTEELIHFVADVKLNENLPGGFMLTQTMWVLTQALIEAVTQEPLEYSLKVKYGIDEVSDALLVDDGMPRELILLMDILNDSGLTLEEKLHLLSWVRPNVRQANMSLGLGGLSVIMDARFGPLFVMQTKKDQLVSKVMFGLWSQLGLTIDVLTDSKTYTGVIEATVMRYLRGFGGEDAPAEDNKQAMEDGGIMGGFRQFQQASAFQLDHFYTVK